jgi:ABC-type multidrug transport system ATPase subunit
MLKSFLQLIAGLTHFKRDEPVQLIRKHVDGYVERNFGKKLVKETLDEFDSFLEITKSGIDIFSYLETACENINKEFSVKLKTLILTNIFNFYSASSIDIYSDSEENILERIASWLKISDEEYLCLKYFTNNRLHLVPQKKNLLIVAGENPSITGIRYLKSEGLKGFLIFLFLPRANILLFNYNGTSAIELNGNPIFAKNNYIFSSGLLISGKDIGSIYYGYIIKTIIQPEVTEEICLKAIGVSYNYSRDNKGIQNLSLTTFSGELIGIMGSSGVGKSTLLKLLSGVLKPTNGEVFINEYNLSNIKKNLQDITGTLHQEECLVEELTVYENLYFNTKLALGAVTNEEIKRTVETKLHELDLIDCMHNRVGSPGNRKLSGGQRKRLAIAMELVREPKILFVDEPTSGLSSSDSDAVMNILKSTALEGKLVVVNIHQPSSEIFKLFDRVFIIDKGGVPIFSGNPVEAILHFKGIANRVDKLQSSCECCGNLKPELILDIIEERNIDELGFKTAHRKLTPIEWNSFLSIERTREDSENHKNLPVSKYSVAIPLQQFFTFFKRNTLTKIRNGEFIFLALVLPPVLAVIMSIFLRYSLPKGAETATYTFYSNPNLASFFLMCILASLFFGLILSCEDIFRDKQLIVREKSMGLSIKSFYNAKIFFLAILSLYQTLAFVVFGFLIIELRGFTLPFWLMLFLVSMFGNLLGLIVSSTLKSIVAIYVLVPFLLIPQILFSGLVVRFDNLNPKLTLQNKVPVVGELMITRWAEEALIVHFYINNNFNKSLFKIDLQQSELRFLLLNLIPELQRNINEHNPIDKETRLLIENGVIMLTDKLQTHAPDEIFSCSDTDFPGIVTKYLDTSKEKLASRYSNVNFLRDNEIERLYPNTEQGRENLISSRNIYHNKSIDDLVRNRFYPSPIVKHGSNYIQKTDPIFQVSNSLVGRSHFLAPYKMIANSLMGTFWYNFIVGLLMIFFLYILFIYNVFPYLIKQLQRMTFFAKSLIPFVLTKSQAS